MPKTVEGTELQLDDAPVRRAFGGSEIEHDVFFIDAEHRARDARRVDAEHGALDARGRSG